MPRLLALGHVSRDRRPGGDVLGGSVTFGALAARRLGWEAAILTSAGPDFEPERELPGIPAFVRRSSATTRFVNEYDADGTRHQVVTARAEDVDLEALPARLARPRRAAPRAAGGGAGRRGGHRAPGRLRGRDRPGLRARDRR